MLAKDIARPFTKIDKDSQIPQAWETLEGRKESHLVVVEDDVVIGIVSIKDFLFPIIDKARRRHFARFYVSSIMTPNPISVKEDTPLVDVLRIMLEKGISSVLVYKEKPQFADRIITKKDLLKNISKFPPSKVSDIGTMNNIITGSPGTKINTAVSILKDKKISTLPIVERNRLIGYSDVRLISEFIITCYLDHPQHFHTILKQATLEDIMRSPITVEPEDTIQTIAPAILRRNFKGAVIAREITPLGVVTETDVAKYILSVLTKQSQ